MLAQASGQGHLILRHLLDPVVSHVLVISSTDSSSPRNHDHFAPQPKPGESLETIGSVCQFWEMSVTNYPSLPGTKRSRAPQSQSFENQHSPKQTGMSLPSQDKVVDRSGQETGYSKMSPYLAIGSHRKLTILRY